jgi:hypothetical protein
VRARDKEEYVCVRATKIEVTIEMYDRDVCESRTRILRSCAEVSIESALVKLPSHVSVERGKERKKERCVYTYTQHRMSLYFQNEALDSFIMDIGQTQY